MGQAESKEAEQNSGQTPQHVRRNTVHGTGRTRRPTPPIADPVSPYLANAANKGQVESKEAEQNSSQTPQHVRRNTVQGTVRTRRPTPPIADPIPSRPTEPKRTLATPGAPSPQRPANTPQTFPRSRGLTNVRPRLTPSAASQRSATANVRTSGRLQQQFAIRPAKTAAASTSSPVLPTPSRSQPIPISQPSTRSRPERRPVQDRSRPTVRRAAPPTRAALQTSDSDLEPAGPPAKRVTRSRTAVVTADKTPAPPAPIELDQDLELDGSDDDESESSEEESDVSDETASVSSASDGSSLPARQPVVPPVAETQFHLRRSRRRSVPVRHLQVDPHRASYVSV